MGGAMLNVSMDVDNKQIKAREHGRKRSEDRLLRQLTFRNGVEEKHQEGKKKQPKEYQKNEKSQRNKTEKVSRKWP